MKKEYYFMAALVLIAVLFRLPVLDYAPVGDNIKYSELARSIHEDGAYVYQGESHIQHPPLYPFAASLLLYFTDNAVLATKLVNALFSGMTAALLYLILRRRFSHVNSLLISLTVLFNPWYFYFTGDIGLSEGLASFLVLLSFYSLYRYFETDSRRFLILSASMFGLAIMARLSVLFMIAPIYAYFAYRLLKKDYDGIIFVGISAPAFVLWQLRSILSAVNDPYLEYWSKSIISYPHALIYFFIIVLPVAYMLLLLPMFKAFKKKHRDKFYMILAGSFILHILMSILSWDLVNHIGLISNPWNSNFTIHLSKLTNVLFATRYYLTILPVITFFSVIHLKKTKWLVPYVFILFFVSIFYSYGSIQNTVSEIVPLPVTYVQRADAGTQVAAYVEDMETIRLDIDSDNEITDYSAALEYTLGQRGVGVSDTGVLITDKKLDKPELYQTTGRAKYYVYSDDAGS